MVKRRDGQKKTQNDHRDTQKAVESSRSTGRNNMTTRRPTATQKDKDYCGNT